eukprot:54256-Eustigmatos_ZCMA.PRE.1
MECRMQTERFGANASHYKLTLIRHDKNNPYKANYETYAFVAESIAFHGAPLETIESIAANGFDAAKVRKFRLECRDDFCLQPFDVDVLIFVIQIHGSADDGSVVRY